MEMNDQFTKVLKLDIEQSNVPFLAGEPGIGKTSIIHSVANSIGAKTFVVMCNQMADKSDLTGARLMPTPDGKSYEQQFFPHEKIAAAVRFALANPNTIVLLVLDEINRSTSDVTSAALTLCTARELGNTVLPENLRILATGNTKGNVTSLDEASLSRFSVYQVNPDAQAVIAYLGDEMNPWVRDTLAAHPELVFEKGRSATTAVSDGDDDDDDVTEADLFESGEEMVQLTTPRTIEYASKWLNEVQKDMPFLHELIQTQSVAQTGRSTTLLQEILEAKLGNTQFTGFLVHEIIAKVTAGSVQAVVTLQAPKPHAWDVLAGVKTMQEREGLIAQLSDHEKSSTMLYALYSDADNSTLLTQLASAMGNSLEREHTQLFVKLAMQGKIERANLSALDRTNTDIGTALKTLVDTVGA